MEARRGLCDILKELFREIISLTGKLFVGVCYNKLVEMLSVMCEKHTMIMDDFNYLVDGMHGGSVFGARNADGSRILEFTDGLILVICNIFLKKPEF